MTPYATLGRGRRHLELDLEQVQRMHAHDGDDSRSEAGNSMVLRESEIFSAFFFGSWSCRYSRCPGSGRSCAVGGGSSAANVAVKGLLKIQPRLHPDAGFVFL
jgi:hypothetical protein